MAPMTPAERKAAARALGPEALIRLLLDESEDRVAEHFRRYERRARELERGKH